MHYSTRSIQLAYGRSGLQVSLPSTADVIEPALVPGLADETAAIRRALHRPLASAPLSTLIHRGAAVGIAVCDVTRPFPARRVLPVLLDELDAAGAGPVSIFIATGTHRLCTMEELDHMLGSDVLAAYDVVQHDAFDTSRHAQLGFVPRTAVPALVERAFLEQDIRITTGFIEPHFFAGFSGGPKMVAPGLAALETVLDLHSALRIGNPRATWGVIEGNPVHDAVRAIAVRAHITFNLDVTLNRNHAITNVFAGELFTSHAEGCRFARTTAMAPTSNAYDVVVTTNSGYPLDQNLYQCVKGMSAAAQISRTGGSIVLAGECADGLPNHGRYKDLLRQAGDPDTFLNLLAQPDFAVHDQWQVQIQAQIQRKASVYVHADGLTDNQIRDAWLEPIDDISDCVEALMSEYGPGARLAVLPQGPLTIPYVSEEAVAMGR